MIQTALKVALTAAFFVVVLGPEFSSQAFSETCTSQSQMAPADRDALAFAAKTLATDMQAGNAADLRSLSVAEVAKDFAAISDVVGNTAAKLKGGTLAVDQVYLLDASTLKRNADGSAADAQFFCTLNKSIAEADFLIPALPPGKYVFAIVEVRGIPAPWRLSFLLRQDQGRWLMAGLYPRPLTAAGHDGLWYWTQARQMTASKEPWNAWLYDQEAQNLLQPAGFVQSTHLEKLQTEQTAAAPPALSQGIGVDTPLVVKAKDGTEYRFTSLAADDSLGASSVDVAVHLKADPLPDQAAARKRNIAAMSALLAAYPELRKPFHGVWVFADVPGQNPYATEQAMSDIP
ncbi:hypothetical protein [Granulicella arctica]|uniref:Uncharacterized protein n=1 Tax=Granulicella arctica TaxID=940613 RepID=A0A7Y9TMF6_9BACT|nr:hypothetical protein [Granulicella arctica]NYF81087.1 hypothetical protein [Granulicella arctica]